MSVITGILALAGAAAEATLAEAAASLQGAARRYTAQCEGSWQQDGVWLGFRGTPLTAEAATGAALPLYDARSGLAITADVLLDNRGELFDRLLVSVPARSGMTDSELLLLAYSKWGEQMVDYLLGDYAFVIWDERAARLFAARDISGNRTLYYCQQEARFAFCTAIAPLLELPGMKRALNEGWLSEFLAIADLNEAVDVHATPYTMIRQLPPAHVLLIREGSITLRRYGMLMPQEQLRLGSNGAFEEAFQAVFREAVDCRLRTHRNVSAALSGGLDSGAVVSFAARSLQAQGKPLLAYSYVPVPDFVDYTSASLLADETAYIRSTVAHVGNIREHYLDFAGSSPFSEIDDMLEIMEGPYKFFENSFWIKGIYAAAEREEAGVLLTGARGNFTISWGPALDYYAQLLRRLRWLKLGRELLQYSRRTGIRKLRLARVVGKRAWHASERLAPPEERYVSELIAPAFAARMAVYERYEDQGQQLNSSASGDPFAVRLSKFQNLSVASKNGAMASKFSLRYGLWERDPTADARVIRFCLALPIEQYVQDGMDRALVRRAMHTHLPDQVRLNQRVRGVQPADWLHRMLPDWRQFLTDVQEMCESPVAGEYLNVPRLREAAMRMKEPQAAHALDVDARMMMQGLIVYRFLRNYA